MDVSLSVCWWRSCVFGRWCQSDLVSELTTYLWSIGCRAWSYILSSGYSGPHLSDKITHINPSPENTSLPSLHNGIQMARKWLSNLTFGMAFCFKSHFQTSHIHVRHTGEAREGMPSPPHNTLNPMPRLNKHLHIKLRLHAQRYLVNHQHIDF